jgi:hypothetical protein
MGMTYCIGDGKSLAACVKWIVHRCATSRMVPGSITGGVTGFFNDIFPSALGWLSPSWKWVTGTFMGVKTAGAWGWQPHQLHVPNVMKSESLNLLEPSGPHRACYGTPLLLDIRGRVQKFPAWHTKAALNGKCCEGYIAPSMVRLMYQYVLK